MNDLLKKLFPQQLPGSEEEILRLIRETLQSVALLGMWRSGFFEHAAFYGGTSLRLLYGLDRFSEDLDFSLLKHDDGFTFSKYSDYLIRELKAYGFEVEFDVKKKAVKSAVESAFIKANTFNQMILIEVPKHLSTNIHKDSIIKINLEVDTNPPPGFDTEMKYIFSPVQYAVRTYTLPSLFAGKMHALMFRKWGSRVKGRDWYDFAWYASNHPVLNLQHLEKRMRQSGDYKKNEPLSKEEFFELLGKSIEVLDISLAKSEVLPFLAEPRSIEIWSKDFFKSAVEKVECI